MLGWASEEPGSILSAVSSRSFFRKGRRLSKTIALLENRRRQRKKRPTVVKAYFSESACGRGASIIMHCFNKVLGRIHQAPRRPAVKLNTCALRKGCLQISSTLVCGAHDSLQRTQMHTPEQDVSLACLPRRNSSAWL